MTKKIKIQEKRIDVLRRILSNHQYEKIDGYIVDGVTAHMLVTIYDAFKQETSRDKFERIALPVLVDWCWKQYKVKE